MASYKETITEANTHLARDPARVFVGYGLTHGRAGGTLAGVGPEQIIETPVAENLMVSLAIGLALRGRRPVVFVERCDFLANAMDAIVNHLDKIEALSRGEFKPGVILRIVVGNRNKPLFTGPVHTQDFSDSIRGMVNFPVVRLRSETNVSWAYESAAERQSRGISTALFEYKDLL